MRLDELRERLRGLPQIASWPQMLELIERPVSRDFAVWDFPIAACLAVGGSEEEAAPGAAAVLCSVISIHLVDDMLDDDPRGDYRHLGVGVTANLALAFQAAGHLLLNDSTVRPEIRAALQESFASMSMATCFGQGLDAQEAQSEEEYWRVVGTKTPPLFAEALRIGALLGGAPAETAEQLARMGSVLGKFIQVSDDLTDALESPARADWGRRGNNLAMLYAMTADHADREEFLRLSKEVDQQPVLAAAQKILLRSGAVSYCALKLIEFSREAHVVFSGLPLSDATPISRLLEFHLAPLNKLLRRAGLEEPVVQDLLHGSHDLEQDGAK